MFSHLCIINFFARFARGFRYVGAFFVGFSLHKSLVQVEIVQQLEFTTSAANSQPQQISTNVTVKTHANASVKSDISSPKAATPGTPGHASKANIGLDVGTLVECVKQASLRLFQQRV